MFGDHNLLTSIDEMREFAEAGFGLGSTELHKIPEIVYLQS